MHVRPVVNFLELFPTEHWDKSQGMYRTFTVKLWDAWDDMPHSRAFVVQIFANDL